jgi:hypothetical protein
MAAGRLLTGKTSPALLEMMQLGIDVTKSLTEVPAGAGGFDWFGLRETLRLRPEEARAIEVSCPPVAIATSLRMRQMRPYNRPSIADDRPGFKIRMTDRDARPKSADKKEMARLQKYFLRGGADYPGSEFRIEGLHEQNAMMARDLMLIDRAAVEPRRNRGGEIVEFVVVDSGTIRKTTEAGFLGKRDDIDPRHWYHADSVATDMLAEARKKLRPDDMVKVRYVQLYQQLWFTLNSRSDLYWRGLGFSPLEKVVNVVSAFINAMAFNTAAVSKSAIPKVALAVENLNYDRARLMALQETFNVMFSGAVQQHRIPIVNAKASVLDFMKSARDVEFKWWMEFLFGICGAVFGVDYTEVGLKLQQTAHVLSEGSGASARKHSKDLGLQDLLLGLETFQYRWLQAMKRPEFMPEYTGVSAEDREQVSKLRTEAVKRDTTVNEERAEQDREPLPWADILLDPVAEQARQAHEQAQRQEEAGGMADEFEAGANEAFDDIFKAARAPLHVRTRVAA